MWIVKIALRAPYTFTVIALLLMIGGVLSVLQMLYLPDNAILIDSKGTRVATVDASNKIHSKDVKLGRDFGTETEILSGITPGEQVVQNPADDLREGMTVSIQQAAVG